MKTTLEIIIYKEGQPHRQSFELGNPLQAGFDKHPSKFVWTVEDGINAVEPTDNSIYIWTHTTCESEEERDQLIKDRKLGFTEL